MKIISFAIAMALICVGCVTNPIDDGNVSVPTTNHPLLVQGYLPDSGDRVIVMAGNKSNPDPAVPGDWDVVSRSASSGGTATSWVGTDWYFYGAYANIREAYWFTPTGVPVAKIMVISNTAGNSYDNLATFESHPYNCPGTAVADLSDCLSPNSPVIEVTPDDLVLSGSDCGKHGEPACPGATYAEQCPWGPTGGWTIDGICGWFIPE